MGRGFVTYAAMAYSGGSSDGIPEVTSVGMEAEVIGPIWGHGPCEAEGF